MATTNEILSIVYPVAQGATAKSPGDVIDAAVYQQMMDVLNELSTHTHIFYDDYTTACDCNCNCNCTRGFT